MKCRGLFGGAVVCAGIASVASADGILLDFEEPDTTSIQQVTQGYAGITWSEIFGGPDLSVMDEAYYHATYGASLDFFGDQVGWNRFGGDNFSMTLPEAMFLKSGNWTPWLGFGPSSLEIELYLDGDLVGLEGVTMVEEQWTFVDFGGVLVDHVVVRNFGDSQWWLMDELVFNKIPAPGALALLGVAGLVARRRRR